MAQATDRPVILAVDDSTDLLALMAKALAAEYRVLTASHAGTALEMAAGEPRPDLILLDVEMPGASGFDLCRVLKSEEGTADIPIIFLTGKTEPKDQAEGFELGAVDYIAKPINSAVLKARVRTHVALSNQRHELERLVGERTAQLENTRLQLIRRLARAMELHESTAVGNRVMRLGQYAKLLAQAAGAKPEICDLMLKAAPLHDVGKLGVAAPGPAQPGAPLPPPPGRGRGDGNCGGVGVHDHHAVLPRRADDRAGRGRDRGRRRHEIRSAAGRGVQEGVAGDAQGARGVFRRARRHDRPGFCAPAGAGEAGRAGAQDPGSPRQAGQMSRLFDKLKNADRERKARDGARPAADEALEEVGLRIEG